MRVMRRGEKVMMVMEVMTVGGEDGDDGDIGDDGDGGDGGDESDAGIFTVASRTLWPPSPHHRHHCPHQRDASRNAVNSSTHLQPTCLLLASLVAGCRRLHTRASLHAEVFTCLHRYSSTSMSMI